MFSSESTGGTNDGPGSAQVTPRLIQMKVKPLTKSKESNTTGDENGNLPQDTTRFPKGTPEFYRIMSTNSGSNPSRSLDMVDAAQRRSKSKDTPRVADEIEKVSPLGRIRSLSESPAQQGTSDSEGENIISCGENELEHEHEAIVPGGRASTGDLHTRINGNGKPVVKKRKSKSDKIKNKSFSSEDLSFQYAENFDWTCYGEIV